MIESSLYLFFREDLAVKAGFCDHSSGEAFESPSSVVRFHVILSQSQGREFISRGAFCPLIP